MFTMWKPYTHMMCEVNNWDMGMGQLWLNGWGIYHLMDETFMAGLGIYHLMGRTIMVSGLGICHLMGGAFTA